eukprot:190116-Hanusia_phi.AAC.1
MTHTSSRPWQWSRLPQREGYLKLRWVVDSIAFLRIQEDAENNINVDKRYPVVFDVPVRIKMSEDKAGVLGPVVIEAEGQNNFSVQLENKLSSCSVQAETFELVLRVASNGLRTSISTSELSAEEEEGGGEDTKVLVKLFRFKIPRLQQ